MYALQSLDSRESLVYPGHIPDTVRVVIVAVAQTTKISSQSATGNPEVFTARGISDRYI